MKLIRKFSLPLTVLSVLSAAVAAPYMIAENPDSAVFRSGALGLLLLVGTGYPLLEALRRADRRTLTCGMVFGFLFSFALSLGSELFVYDGLLPGAGSLVRRFAVPVLATPLLGGFSAFLMLPRDFTAQERKTRTIPGWVFFAVILVCWLPLLPAYFPGMLNYDFPAEYQQHLNQEYTSLHPLLHSALMNTVITIGEAIHSRTFGVLLMSLVQMPLFAASLAYSCSFAQRRGAPRIVLAALTALYALHPVFSVMSLSMTKDTLFAACVLMLSLFSYEALEDADAFFASHRKLALFVLCCAGTALLRNNGIFALALLLPALMLALRSRFKRALALCAASVCACLLTLAALTLFLKPVHNSSFQLYSIPAQQLVRAYSLGVMTEEEKAELESWYIAPEGLAVHSHLADSAKGYLNRERIEREGGDMLRLWAQVGKRNLRIYAEALLMLNVGSWYPDDLSHSTIYPDASWSDKGYLQTQEYDMTAQGIHTTSFLPRVKALYERICRHNDHQTYPVISILLCTATPLWVLLFACCRFAASKSTRMIIPSLGVLGLWAGYLLGPCTLPRYTLALFCLAPVMLAAAFSFSSSARKESV